MGGGDVIVRYTQLWKLVQSVRLRESGRPAYMVNGRHDLRAHVADADLRASSVRERSWIQLFQ